MYFPKTINTKTIFWTILLSIELRIEGISAKVLPKMTVKAPITSN